MKDEIIPNGTVPVTRSVVKYTKGDRYSHFVNTNGGILFLGQLATGWASHNMQWFCLGKPFSCSGEEWTESKGTGPLDW